LIHRDFGRYRLSTKVTVTLTLKVRRKKALDAYGELVRAIEKLNLLLDNQLRGFDLTNGQFRVLQSLFRAGPMSQADLGQLVSRDNSDVHVISSNLQKRGLVARRAHDTDRRKVSVHLTPEGRRLITNFLPHREKLTFARMRALTYTEQETLRRVCEKLAEGDPIKFILEMTMVDREEAE